MPYIPKENRRRLKPASNWSASSAGELNYQFTELAIDYVLNHGLSYETLNSISGALTEALAEFRRRVVVPYEAKKISEN
ncbi:MAG: DUF6899 family protein, partial [bacterium]